MLFIDMMCSEIEVLIFGYGVCILYIVGTNFYALLEHISIYCWSSYLCTSAICALLHNSIHCWSTFLCIVRMDILCWNSYLYICTQFYTLLVHNSIHCSMHCLGWFRHDPGTIIPKKGEYFGFYTLVLY